jgi:putative SOS response-associated peptidase YedK
MCNLYSLTPKQNVVADFFRVSHNRTQQFELQNAIFPNYTAPVVRRAADDECEIVPINGASCCGPSSSSSASQDTAWMF